MRNPTCETKVTLIKHLIVPQLELCGAYLLAKLLYYVKAVFHVPSCDVYVWTDRMTVLSCLLAKPRQFKMYVANRVSLFVELIVPKCWNHVSETEIPTDCAARGSFPSKLWESNLLWHGLKRLPLDPSKWPRQSTVLIKSSKVEREV